MRSICLYYNFLLRVPYRRLRIVGLVGAVGPVAQRQAGEELVLELHIRLEYPDARDAGELVGGDGLGRGGVVAAAVQAEATAEAREARGQRVAGAIGARRRVAHPSVRQGGGSGRRSWGRRPTGIDAA